MFSCTWQIFQCMCDQNSHTLKKAVETLTMTAMRYSSGKW